MVPHNIDQAIVSIRLDDCSRTLATTTLPAELANDAVTASSAPNKKVPVPPRDSSCSAAPIDCQNSIVTPPIAATPAPQVRPAMGVPNAMRAHIGVQNTISANSTA